MVSTVPFDLDPYVRGCLWINELLLLNLENVASIAQLPAPPAGNWCDVYFYRGDDVDEVLEACPFHVAFHLANREELWPVVQLLWGPNHGNMHAHQYPADACHTRPSTMMHSDRAVDAVAVINTQGAEAVAPGGALHGLMATPVLANRILPTADRLARIVDRIAFFKEPQWLLDSAYDVALMHEIECSYFDAHDQAEFNNENHNPPFEVDNLGVAASRKYYNMYRSCSAFVRRDISGENNFRAWFTHDGRSQINNVLKVIGTADLEESGEGVLLSKAILATSLQQAEQKLLITTDHLDYLNGDANASTGSGRSNLETVTGIGQVLLATFTTKKV